jgi:hypothetical protein
MRSAPFQLTLRLPALWPHERFATRFLPKKSSAWTASPSSAARKIIRLRRFNVSTLDLSLPRCGMRDVVDLPAATMVASSCTTAEAVAWPTSWSVLSNAADKPVKTAVSF